MKKNQKDAHEDKLKLKFKKKNKVGEKCRKTEARLKSPHWKWAQEDKTERKSAEIGGGEGAAGGREPAACSQHDWGKTKRGQ